VSEPLPTVRSNRPGWIASLVAMMRDDPPFVGAMLVALVASVVPIWASDLLPMMDMPQHLATVRILHSFDDPAFGVSKWHVVDLSATQYLSWYLLVLGLAKLMSIEAAVRVALSLYAVALPLSVASYLGAHRRDRAVALLAAPLVFNTFYFMGFANYIGAIPMIFWGLAVYQRALDDFTWKRWAILVGLSLLMFYTHAQAFVLYGALAGLNTFIGPRGLHPRHWWRQASHIVPSLIAMTVWVVRSALLASDEVWHKAHGGRNVADTKVKFQPLLDRLTQIPRAVMEAYTDDSDEKILVLTFGLLIAWVLIARPWTEKGAHRPDNRAPDNPDEPDEPGLLKRRIPAIFAMVTLVAYVLSPISWKWIWPISTRLVPVLALLLLAVPMWRRIPWRTWTMLLPATVLILWSSMIHVQKARAFTSEVGPIREVVAKADKGSRLMSLVYGPNSRVLAHSPLIHVGQYHVLVNGGMASFSFVNFPQSPVLYPTIDGPPHLPMRFEWTPHRFTVRDHGWWYDYVLVRGDGQPLRGQTDRFKLVIQKNPYRLYKNLRPGER